MLPVSRAMTKSNSSKCCSNCAAALSRISERSRGPVATQAAWARPIAASMSAALPTPVCHRTLPLAGSITSCRPASGVSHFPSKALPVSQRAASAHGMLSIRPGPEDGTGGRLAGDSPGSTSSAVGHPGQTLEQAEASLMAAALQRTAGNAAATARHLGITRATLIYRARRYGIPPGRTSKP